VTSSPSTTEVGQAGVRIAAFRLSAALLGESAVATQDEEGHHIDLYIGFSSPYAKLQRTIAAQVKTGHFIKHGPRSRIQRIKKQHIESWAGSQFPVVVIAIEPGPVVTDRYRFIRPRTAHDETLSCSKYDFISPSLRFVAEREIALRHPPAQSPLLQIPTFPTVAIAPAREQARIAYKQLRSTTFAIPGMGSVRFTQHGWKHITRRSSDKSRAKFLDSYQLLTHLHQFDGRAPHRHEVLDRKLGSDRKWVHETNTLLLRYLSVFFGDSHYEVFLRLIERISYPKKWAERTDLTACVSRDLFFESIYRKPAG